MANRNFRKNLALLYSLTASYGVLNSVNVSTSAMDSLQQKYKDDESIEEFKKLYNPRMYDKLHNRPTPELEDRITLLNRFLPKLEGPQTFRGESSSILLNACLELWTKTKTLNELKNATKKHEKQTDKLLQRILQIKTIIDDPTKRTGEDKEIPLFMFRNYLEIIPEKLHRQMKTLMKEDKLIEALTIDDDINWNNSN